MYVGDLGMYGDKYEIERKFERFGSLREVWVAKNPPGFAFVMFEDPRDAEDACRSLDGTKICGQVARVEVSHGRSKPRRHGGYPPRDMVVSSRYRRRSRSRSGGRRRSRSRSRSRDRRSRSRSKEHRRR